MFRSHFGSRHFGSRHFGSRRAKPKFKPPPLPGTLGSSTMEYIGREVSLISNQMIRYKGILDSINAQESTITLLNLHQPAHATGSSSASASSGCPAFQFNIHAEEFQPGRAVPDQSDFVHELYLIWTARVFTWEQETPSAPIITWFVDHRGFPICAQGRSVQLDDQYHDWDLGRSVAAWN
jgi:hypothetical protein